MLAKLSVSVNAGFRVTVWHLERQSLGIREIVITSHLTELGPSLSAMFCFRETCSLAYQISITVLLWGPASSKSHYVCLCMVISMCAVYRALDQAHGVITGACALLDI